MLRQIFKESFWGIAFTYAVTLLEFTSFSLMPYLIGLAIDGLLVGQIGSFLTYSALLVFGMLVGTVRRMCDTRIFGEIYTRKAKSVIAALHRTTLDRRRMVSRYGLVGLYSDFFEFTIPNVMSLAIGLLVALAMISLIDPWLVALIAPSFCVTVLSNSMLSRRIQQREYEMQHLREEISQSLVDGKDCDGLLSEQLRVMVRKSDLESWSWCATDAVNLVVELACLYMVTTSGLTMGEITSVLMYTGRVFDKAHMVHPLFGSLRLVEMTDDLLGSSLDKRVKDGLDP